MLLLKLRFVIITALSLHIFGAILPVTPVTKLILIQAMAQTPEDKLAEAERLYMQGQMLLKTSNYNEASESFQKALSIFQALGDLEGEAKALHNLEKLENPAYFDNNHRIIPFPQH
jgi:uncharacterized protein HemY